MFIYNVNSTQYYFYNIVIISTAIENKKKLNFIDSWALNQAFLSIIFILWLFIVFKLKIPVLDIYRVSSHCHNSWGFVPEWTQINYITWNLSKPNNKKYATPKLVNQLKKWNNTSIIHRPIIEKLFPNNLLAVSTVMYSSWKLSSLLNMMVMDGVQMD